MDAHGCLFRWGWGLIEASDSRMDQEDGGEGEARVGKENSGRNKVQVKSSFVDQHSKEDALPWWLRW